MNAASNDLGMRSSLRTFLRAGVAASALFVRFDAGCGGWRT
jgi:hypothetical protein